MRGYSLRSTYPLARSSQSRRRLMLLYNLNAPAAEPEEPLEAEHPSTHAVPEPRSVWELDDADQDDQRTLDVDELRRLHAESFPESREFVDQIFEEAESRNEALQSGRASESVLDEDEAADADAGLGEESLILSGQEDESQIFSMEDLREPAVEEMPGSAGPEDRKPHLPSWYVPNFKTVKRLLDGEKPVTWMFAGESAASAVDLAQGRRNFTDHFSDRLRMELGRMLDVVINTGDTGETSGNLLKNIEWRVLRFHPEVVSILLGRNDAQRGSANREAFQNSLEQIVQIVRESGAILVLHTPNRVDSTKAGQLADLENYVQIVRQTAEDYSIPLVDHWEHWNRQKPDAEFLRTWLAADGVQPGVYGQREMAKLLFQRFDIFDPNSPICNARVP